MKKPCPLRAPSSAAQRADAAGREEERGEGRERREETRREEEAPAKAWRAEVEAPTLEERAARR